MYTCMEAFCEKGLFYGKNVACGITGPVTHRGARALILDEQGGSELFNNHLFHFLECMIVLFTGIVWRGWELGSIDTIVMVSFRDATWMGKKTRHNHDIVRMLFPNVVNFCTRSDRVVCDEALYADRYLCDTGTVNKMFLKYARTFPRYLWCSAVFAGQQRPPPRRRDALRVVYVNRQGADRRRLDDDAAMLHALHTCGFCDVTDVRMEDVPFAEQIATVADADVLIGVHGNGLSHAMFMRPERYVIELFAGDYVWDYQMMCKCMGHEYFLMQDGGLRSHALNMGCGAGAKPGDVVTVDVSGLMKVMAYIKECELSTLGPTRMS